MRRSSEMLLWAAVTIMLAAGTSYVISRHVGGHELEDRAAETGEDFHHWMHEQLQLTESQHQTLAPLERAFEKDSARLKEEMAAAGRQLAGAVREGDPDASAVDAALVRLNAAQTELQRTMLEHFFTMKKHLDPEQAEKLLEWTHDSIVHE